MRASASIALTLWSVACGSSAPPPPTARPPSSRPPVGTSECTRFAEVSRDNCRDDFKASFDVCQDQARIAEAGACVAQAQRSYDCSMEGMTKCSGDGCCEPAFERCAPINVALEHCLRGYCSSHAGNPDCAIYF